MNNECENIVTKELATKRQPELTDNEAPRKKAKTENKSDYDHSGAPFGIDAFVSDGPTIDLMVRHRYSDFVVNEIDCDGNLVELTDFSIPELPQEDRESDFSLLDRQLEEVVRRQAQAVLNDSSVTGSVCLGSNADKITRTAIHKLIRHISDKLVSTTVTSEGQSKIEIVKRGSASDKGPQRKEWPKGAPQYTSFVLYKENLDTGSAVYRMAKALRVGSVSRFSYAGMKDKRGKTSQLISCFRLLPSELIKVNSRCDNIKVGNFRFIHKQLKLGDLTGNRFTIVLRGVKDSMRRDLEDRTVQLAKSGFINYFGRQRFGCHNTSTDEIGLLMLRGEWKQAAQAILDPSAARDEWLQMALHCYQKGENAAKAVTFMANGACKDSTELRLLNSLAESPNDYQGALNKIPRNLRTLYLHAYQSKVWNRIASFRLRKYGLHVKAGDLLQGEDGQITTAPEDDCADVFDVVLPLIGFKTKYPSNEVSEELDKILKEDGIDRSAFDCINKEYCLAGDYRRWLCRPIDLTFEFKRYEDLDEKCDVNCCANESKETALVLQFTLPASSYATMALREMLKKDIETSRAS